MYFPDFHGEAECHKCELADCQSREKHQRNKRDFECTSGRCPKLPDVCGFVHPSQRENQRKAYPLIHAESNGEEVFLTVSRPGSKRLLRVYETKSGYTYFKTKDEDGCAIKRVVFVEGNRTHKDVLDFMEWRKADYCIFACEISECTV